LPEAHRPEVIFDLDDTAWSHVPTLVAALSDALGEDLFPAFYIYRHTRNIPQVQQHMDLHDEIQRGNHPTYFPFVNYAHEFAPSTIQAVQHMGHQYTFLTARMPHLYDVTVRALQWNGIHPAEAPVAADAITHEIPRQGLVYCAHVEPSQASAYKAAVVNQWLDNMRSREWKGELVIVDDMIHPFAELLASGKATGLALVGPLNESTAPVAGERRMRSWYDIAQELKQVQERALASADLPVRLFDCGPEEPDALLVVAKEEAGLGEFRLDELPSSSYLLVTKGEWANNAKGIMKQVGVTQ
jgi:hypothetical protein